jgi:hypothetical protein
MHHAWTLHLENVALRREVKQLHRRLLNLERYRRCVYCGAPARRRKVTCTAHSDLVGNDPVFVDKDENVRTTRTSTRRPQAAADTTPT